MFASSKILCYSRLAAWWMVIGTSPVAQQVVAHRHLEKGSGERKRLPHHGHRS